MKPTALPSWHVFTFAHVSAACQVRGSQQQHHLYGLTMHGINLDGSSPFEIPRYHGKVSALSLKLD
jgi:hypothetical protein